MKIFYRAILFLVLIAAVKSNAAYISFGFTNSLGQPDTNFFYVVKCGATLADGSVINQGVPIRMYPQADGLCTNWFETGNYYATNGFIGGPYNMICFRVPSDTSSNIYFFTKAGVWVSGGNFFVDLTLGSGSTNSAGVTNAVATNAPLPSISNGTIAVPTNYDAYGQATNVVAPWTNQVTASSIHSAGASTNAYLNKVFTLEQYGGAADEKKTIATATASSGVLSGPSGTWTSADVGKICELFQDSTNLTAVSGKISSFTSSSSITISINSGVSGSYLFKWGTDNKPPFTNCLNAMTAVGGGVMQLQDGVYGFGGTFDLQNDGIRGLINLPATLLRANATNNNNTYLITGLQPAIRAYSSQGNGPCMSGTILDLLAQPPTAGYTNAFFSQNANGDYALEQFTFKNLTIRQMQNPPASAIYAAYGGSIWLSGVNIDTEFPTNYLTAGNPSFTPTNNVLNPMATYAVQFPFINNNDKIGMDHVNIFGYGVGVGSTEHSVLDNTIIQGCGTGIAVQSTGNSYPAYAGNSTHIRVCNLPFWIAGNGKQYTDFNVELEEYSSVFYYDPSNDWSGSLVESGSPWVGSAPPNLNFLSIKGGHKYTPEGTVNSGVTASELGANPINANMVFDFVPVPRVGDTIHFDTRDINNYAGQVTAGSYSITSSPAGPAISFSGGLVEFQNGPVNSAQSNLLVGLTNCTVDVVVNTTNINGVYPFQTYGKSGPFLLEINVNNSTNYFTIVNTNGTSFTATNIVATGTLTNSWHEYDLVYNGSTIVGYVDGVAGTPVSASGVLESPPNSGQFYIGDNTYNSYNSEIRVWSTPFSASAINTLVSSHGIAYSGNFAGNAGGLTNLQGSQVSGTVPLATSAGSITGILGYTNLPVNVVTNVTGANGITVSILNNLLSLGISGLSGSLITSGTIGNSYLPAAISVTSLTANGTGGIGNNGSQGINNYTGGITNSGSGAIQASTGGIIVSNSGNVQIGGSGQFIGNGSGLTNLTALTATTATNLVTLTNVMALGALDCSKAITTLTTNASFTFSSPINYNAAAYNQSVIYIHNTSGSAITITAPANCVLTPNSSTSCTNNSMATLFVQLGVWTNLTITAIN